MSYPLKDLTGQRFGLVTVVDRAESKTYGAGARGTKKRTLWNVVCDCGAPRVMLASNLRGQGVRTHKMCKPQAEQSAAEPTPARRNGPGWAFVLLVLMLAGCSGDANLGALLGDHERCTLFGEYAHTMTPTSGCEPLAFSRWYDEDDDGTCAFRVSGDATGRVDCDAGEPTARCEGNVKVGECSYRMVWLLEQ